jgi:branched-chain amino acid transport system substrate-binding protein
MHRRLKATLALGLAAMLGAGATGCGSTSSSASGAGGSKDTIKLPVISMLTGDVSYYGQLFMQGAELAVDQVNAAGGVNGAQIQLVKEDNASGNAQTVTLLRKYCADRGVGILIAPTYQVNSDAGGPVSNGCGLPTVTGVGDIDKGTNPKGFMYKDTTVRQPDQIADTLKWAIAKTGARRVAQMADEAVGPYVLYRDVGTKYLKDNGIPEVGSQTVKGSAGDYGPQITALAAVRPDLVVVTLQPPDAARFIQQARGRGLKATFVATCGCLNNATLFKASHGAATGFLSSAANPPVPQADLAPAFAEFAQAFAAKFGKITDTEAVYTYDAVKLVAAAIAKAGTSTDRAKIKQALDAMPRFCGALCYTNAGGGVYKTTKLYFTRLTEKGFVVEQ